jgi:hypothetical protein
MFLFFNGGGKLWAIPGLLSSCPGSVFWPPYFLFNYWKLNFIWPGSEFQSVSYRENTMAPSQWQASEQCDVSDEPAASSSGLKRINVGSLRAHFPYFPLAISVQHSPPPSWLIESCKKPRVMRRWNVVMSPRDSEPRMTGLAKATNNLPEPARASWLNLLSCYPEDGGSSFLWNADIDLSWCLWLQCRTRERLRPGLGRDR